MSQLPINIVVLGKSGTGKSSLCNYLFERPGYFKTGAGKPVTSWEENFQAFSFDYNGHLLNVFDSVGLEPDNYLEWLRRFEQFVDDRQQKAEEPEEWVHGAFYVVNANSARIEPVDRALIELLLDLRIPLQVILTNADVAGDKVAALQAEIGRLFPGVPATPACSVGIRKRGGQSTQPFGRDDILRLYVQQSHQYLSTRLAVLACDQVLKTLDDMHSRTIGAIKAADLSVFKLFRQELDDILSVDSLDEAFGDAFDNLRSFDDYLASFGFNGNWEFSNEFDEAMDHAIEGFESELMAKLDKLESDFEFGTLWDKTKAMVTAGKMLLTLESTLIDYMNQGIERLEGNVRSLRAKYAEPKEASNEWGWAS